MSLPSGVSSRPGGGVTQFNRKAKSIADAIEGAISAVAEFNSRSFSAPASSSSCLKEKNTILPETDGTFVDKIKPANTRPTVTAVYLVPGTDGVHGRHEKQQLAGQRPAVPKHKSVASTTSPVSPIHQMRSLKSMSLTGSVSGGAQEQILLTAIGSTAPAAPGTFSAAIATNHRLPDIAHQQIPKASTTSFISTPTTSAIKTSSYFKTKQIREQVSKSTPVGNINKNNSNKNNNKNNSSSNNNNTKPIRPSFADQLAAISAKAESVTTQMNQRNNNKSNAHHSAPTATDRGHPLLGASGHMQHPINHSLLFSMPAKSFTIGKLTCRYPSPVKFFPDRCEYTFNHPFEATEVQMTIFYRHISAFSLTGNCMKLKLPKKLGVFKTDFDPQNPAHLITVEMASALAVSMVREKIQPLVQQLALKSG